MQQCKSDVPTNSKPHRSTNAFPGLKRCCVRALSAVDARLGDLLELPFLGELAREDVEVTDDLLARAGDGLLRSDGAVGLHAHDHLGNVGVRNLVGGEGDLLHLEERGVDEIAERVILLLEREDFAIRHS